ncbi:MAG: sugar-binding domain-containing protein [Bacteroidota bacterium]
MNHLSPSLILCSALLLFTLQSMGAPANSDRLQGIALIDGWQIQSSEECSAGGAALSLPGYVPQKWFPTTVPSTVLGALVRDSVYKNIWFGDNLAGIPVGRFKKPWWYRCAFDVPRLYQGQHAMLCFDGIIYRANVWINGVKVADADTTKGVYRRFSIDVSNVVRIGEANAVAVEIIPPVKGEPSVGFVDWNPPAPDANMGIWRSVRLVLTGPVGLENPFVQSRVDLRSLHEAWLSVSTELCNHTGGRLEATVNGSIEGIQFSKQVSLGPHERRLIQWNAGDTPALAVKNPRLWWPHDMGTPELYTLHLTCETHGAPSGTLTTRFGIRQVSDYINADGYRGYMVNGKKILIRGGGWTDDLLLDSPAEKIKAQVRYVRQMNLNAIRLEGFWGTDDLFNDCDEEGVLVMAGLSCQWEWDETLGKEVDPRYGGITSPGDKALVARMWEDQILWLRTHPSILVWLYGSDKYPDPGQERTYLRILKERDPQSPSLASAKGCVSEVSGPSAVKMLGPYEYVPPVYWFEDTAKGGAYGFNTETGPGAQVPPVESVRKMIPQDSLWPQGSLWDFHCCRGNFRSLFRYNAAMDHRLGKPSSLEEYCTKAQYLNYEGMRAMYEAFTSHKYHSTGVIQWMLNAAWPKMFWQLYDYYLLPNGAFYGARKAGEPIHILYDPSTRNVVLVNNGFAPRKGCRVRARVLDFDLTERYTFGTVTDVGPDESKVLACIPAIGGLSKTYFVDLRVNDDHAMPVSTNFYALSTQPDELVAVDTSAESWYLTPIKQYANLTALNTLPKVTILERHTTSASGGEGTMTIFLENRDRGLAFQVELMLLKGKDGDPVVPVFLDDNYISLLPGEQRVVTARYALKDLDGQPPVLRTTGWNLKNVESLKGGR